MLYDTNPLLTTFADKWAVRRYVADRVGPELLTEVYALVSDPEELDLDALPERFVVKPTHGSGAVIIVDDRADPGARIPYPTEGVDWTVAKVRVRREQVRSPAFTALTRSWLGAVYAKGSEPAYVAVPPRLIVEELLDRGDGQPPPDYKFWCFNGRVGFLQIDIDRFIRHRRALFSRDGWPIRATIVYAQPDIPPSLPPDFPLLVQIAELLAQDVDFVRVDLYSLNGARRVLGELTCYPGGGGEVMRPGRPLLRYGASWRPHCSYGPYIGRCLVPGMKVPLQRLR